MLIMWSPPPQVSPPMRAPRAYAVPLSSLMAMLCALAIPWYSASGSKVAGTPLTSRRRVRSNTCMPCWPAPSATTKAWLSNTFTSRHIVACEPGVFGRLPRYTGSSGSEMSINDVPSVRPTIAYSRPVSGSVHPQTSFTWVLRPPPIASIGRNERMSTREQSN